MSNLFIEKWMKTEGNPSQRRKGRSTSLKEDIIMLYFENRNDYVHQAQAKYRQLLRSFSLKRSVLKT